MGCGSSIKVQPSCDRPFFDTLKLTKSVELTSEQKYLIRETWKLLEVSKKDIGVLVYKRFLSMHPELKKHFTEFRAIDLSEITRKHGHPKRLVSALENAVTSMGDSESYSAYLIELGRRHSKLGLKITKLHFDDLRKCYISVIMEVLGKASFWNTEIETAWNALFNSISTMMLKGLESH